MKESKRVQQAINTLETMLEYLHYYMGDCPEFRRLIKYEVKNVEELLRELAVDQKIQGIKIAKKIMARMKEDDDSQDN